MTFESVRMRRPSFEGGPTFPRMERAEARLEGAFRRGFPYRTEAENRQSTREAIAAKCQAVHEKILGYGLLPSLLAFMATGLGRERARDVLDGTSESGLFSTITPENADAILSAAQSGMTAATCAAMMVLLAVGANQFRGAHEQKKFDVQEKGWSSHSI